MSVKTESKTATGTAAEPVRPVRFMGKADFRAAKKRVFTKHAPLLAKLAK